MLTTPLEFLLDELNKTPLFSFTTLALNKQNICYISLPTGPNVQFELDKYEKNLVIGSTLGILERGKYRNDIFREALKANGSPLPRYGIFAYSKKSQNLILYDFLDLRDLRGEKIAEFMMPFLEKAKIWQDALSSNSMPITQPPVSDKDKLNIFGFKL